MSKQSGAELGAKFVGIDSIVYGVEDMDFAIDSLTTGDCGPSNAPMTKSFSRPDRVRVSFSGT